MSETLRGLPPAKAELPAVAPQPKETAPRTLEDLYREAVADGVSKSLAKWIGIRARAAGRKAIAESQLRRLESQDNTVHYRAAMMVTDVARELAMENGVNDIAFGRAEKSLADAIEHLSAADAVIALLREGGRK